MHERGRERRKEIRKEKPEGPYLADFGMRQNEIIYGHEREKAYE